MTNIATLSLNEKDLDYIKSNNFSLTKMIRAVAKKMRDDKTFFKEMSKEMKK